MNILIVDDHSMIAEALATQIALLDKSFTVSFCDDLRAARTMINTKPPDIIFLDVRFNNDPTAGLRFLDELKEAGSESRIIMISALNDGSTLGKAIGSGAVGFIAKSAKDSSSIHRAIVMVGQGGVYIDRGQTVPPDDHGSDPPGPTMVGKEELGITAARIYEVLWHLSIGVKGYRRVARKMNIAEGTVEEFAREGYSKLNVHGKDGFLVMLAQKGWTLRPPQGVAP